MKYLVAFALLGIASNLHSEEWNCRNDVEVQCVEGCKVSGEFTPMDVTVDDQGKVNACAYSGCWEGQGQLLKTDDFLAVAAHALKFSTSDSDETNANVLVAVDLGDGIGVIKVNSFAMPLVCKRQ